MSELKTPSKLEKIGIGGERVQMYNLSSSEAPRFVQIAEEMTRKILSLGPNPIKAAMKRMAA
jgi:coenzyme F420-reducing hydrogenase delta subunit